LATTGGSISGDFTLTGSSTNTKVTITDSKGAAVDQINLGTEATGTIPFTWNGTDSNGNAVSPGTYNIQVTGLIGGKNTAVATNIQSKVESVTLGTGSSGLQVNLQGLAPVAFSKVTSIE
jgi:flagellar basal-body rod modification protein FlgD